MNSVFLALKIELKGAEHPLQRDKTPVIDGQIESRRDVSEATSPSRGQREALSRSERKWLLSEAPWLCQVLNAGPRVFVVCVYLRLTGLRVVSLAQNVPFSFPPSQQ